MGMACTRNNGERGASGPICNGNNMTVDDGGMKERLCRRVVKLARVVKNRKGKLRWSCLQVVVARRRWNRDPFD
jgi:hypothetical protein